MKLFLITIALILAVSMDLAAGGAPSASEIERSQQLLEEQKKLRERIYEEDGIFVERIILKGVGSLNSEKIDAILGPFQQKKWFSRRDIQDLIETIEAAYKNNKLPILPKVSYRVVDSSLEITVEETPKAGG